MYSLRMSVWIVPPSSSGGDPLLLRRDDVEGEQDRRRRVDRHRDGDPVERDPVEERLHVVDGVERDPLHPDLAERAVRGRSRAPSASACRTRSRGRSGRGRAGSGSACWSPRPCRSRRTGASSRAAPGTSTGRRRACRGRCRAAPRRARVVVAQVVRGVERLDRVPGEGLEGDVALALGGVVLLSHWCGGASIRARSPCGEGIAALSLRGRFAADAASPGPTKSTRSSPATRAAGFVYLTPAKGAVIAPMAPLGPARPRGRHGHRQHLAGPLEEARAGPRQPLGRDRLPRPRARLQRPPRVRPRPGRRGASRSSRRASGWRRSARPGRSFLGKRKEQRPRPARWLEVYYCQRVPITSRSSGCSSGPTRPAPASRSSTASRCPPPRRRRSRRRTGTGPRRRRRRRPARPSAHYRTRCSPGRAPTACRWPSSASVTGSDARRASGSTLPAIVPAGRAPRRPHRAHASSATWSARSSASTPAGSRPSGGSGDLRAAHQGGLQAAGLEGALHLRRRSSARGRGSARPASAAWRPSRLRARAAGGSSAPRVPGRQQLGEALRGVGQRDGGS